MKNKLLLIFIMIFTFVGSKAKAQNVPYVVTNLSGGNLNIRSGSACTSSPFATSLAQNRKLVGSAITNGSCSYDWFKVDIPLTSAPTTQYYGVKGTGFLECGASTPYIQVSGVGASGLFVRTSAGSGNVTIGGVNAKIWDNQRFATTGSTAYYGGYTWYEIYLTNNCSQTTGWSSGQYLTYHSGQSCTISCSYSISPSSVSLSSSSGSGSVSVTATTGCNWSAVSNNTSWLTVSSGSNGTGNGSVNYSFTSNSSSSSRSGTITIAGHTFTVTQPGISSCSYSISPYSVSPSASSGNGSVAVIASSGCNWTAVSNNASWLTISSGSSGTGNGSVNYSFTSNSSSSSRTGTITIAGYTYTVVQSGSTAIPLYGVDIYSGNGKVNWSTVYTVGSKLFAYVKATKGICYTDGEFINNMTSSNPNGVVLGAYHFALPEDNPGTSGAQAEANYFYSAAHSYIGAGFLPPALDLEPPAGSCIVNSKSLETFYKGNVIALAQWVQNWCERIHTLSNVWPVLYVDACRAALLYPYYQNATINSNIKLWIADYNHSAGNPGNASGCNWVGWPWLFHQYFAPETAGNNPTTYNNPGMDQNIFYGTTTDFKNLIGVVGGSPDLKITAGSQSVSSATVQAGSNFTAYASVDNSGTATAASGTSVGLWLSKSSTLNTNTAIYLGAISGFPSITANTNSLVLNHSVTIPSNTVAGSYYLFYWADGEGCGIGSTCSTCSGAVSESNECNNFATVQITVTSSPVPLQLLSFTATTTKNDVKLTWKTSQEQNMLAYEIERSTDSKTFIKIGEVSSRNSAVETIYQFTDRDVLTNSSYEGYYYRLKQLERDGTFTHSPIEYVKKVVQQTSVQVINTLFSNTLYIRSTFVKPQNVKFVLYDYLGRRLYQKEMRIQAGNNTSSLSNLPNLNSGYYVLQIIYENQMVSYKVFKQ